MPIPLPRAQSFAELLSELIGREVSVKTATAPRTEASPVALKLHAIAVYHDANHVLQAVIHCDLPVGASLGAALVMIPFERVQECVKDKCLDSGLTENLYEVFNVLSALFPKHGAPRLILHAMHSTGNVPDEVKTLLEKPAQRLDLDIDVTGYFAGKLTVLTV